MKKLIMLIVMLVFCCRAFVLNAQIPQTPPDLPSCPEGYVLIDQYDGFLMNHPDSLSKTHYFDLECDSDLVVEGYAIEGHPDDGCSPTGGSGEADYCNQHQDYENFEVDVDGGDPFGMYTDKKGPGGVENAWFPTGKWYTTAAEGDDHELTFTHTQEGSGYQSVGYIVNFCARCEEEDCSDCDGKVTELTLQYDGTQSAPVKVVQKNGDVVFNEEVAPGGQFTFDGTDTGKNGDKPATLGTEITIYVNGTENTDIHTSCSQPIGPGLVRGNFIVIEGYSLNGGLICEVTPDDSTEQDADSDGYIDTIEDLLQVIEDLNLDKKTEKKLLGKVKKVQKELDKGKTDKAIKELQKFIKEVNKLKKGKKKKIPEEDADMLIEYANNIINSL